MRVLHIVPTYLPAYRHGGPILSVHNLNKKLVELGADVTVYTTDINGRGSLKVNLEKETVIDGVKVFYFPSRGFFRLWSYSPSLHKKIKNTVKDFDLIHITSVFLAASTLGAHYAKKSKKPFIISPRGTLMKEPMSLRHALVKKLYLRLIEKINLEKAGAIHFTTQKEADEYNLLGLFCNNRIIIPNSLNCKELDIPVSSGAFRQKFGIPSDKKIVLFLGRLNWKKGFDTLIPAFRAVSEKIPEAILVIAGNDEEGYKKTIESLIRKFNLQDKVIFTDFIFGNDKIAALKDSDVFILPSYSENFGMSVIEAMYMKLPVVVTKGVALSEEIVKSKAGLIIDKNEKNVENTIVYALSHDLEDMKNNARNMVETSFSEDKIGRKWLEAYREIISP